MAIQSFNILGSALTGSDGGQNRTYTLPYTDVTSTGMQIFINGVYQHYTIDYTFATPVITFLNPIYDSQVIAGEYLTGYNASEDVDYCLIQDVYDELDGKTSTDISELRVINAIQQAEGLIDQKTGTSFKSITVTAETHTTDRYSIDVSPDYLDSYPPSVNSRRDTLIGTLANRVKTNFNPIVSVTTLHVNYAGNDAADSWTALTEQTGSGGDFVIEDKNAGIIDFLSDYPRIGKRSWKITYVYGYDRTSTDRRVVMILRVVKRLTVLLASRTIISAKSTGNMFDSMRDVKIGAIEIRAGATSGSAYLKSIEPEIAELWKELSELGIEVI